jgi:hypothetical protein
LYGNTKKRKVTIGKKRRNENELNKAEEKIPGLKTYINSTYAPGVTD